MSYTSLYHCFTQVLNGDKEQEDEDTDDIEEGGILQDNLLHGDPKIKAEANHLEITCNVDENNPKEDVSYEQRESEREKRGVLQSDQRSTKKAKEKVTPSYRLILEEDKFPVSDTVLNNELVLMQFRSGGERKLRGNEQVMAKCEDDMFETDVLIETLISAVKSAQKVISKEMRIEDLGVKFYRCIEMLYGGDMVEIVREDHNKALPVILIRLNQKLQKLTVARERWKSSWKKVFEENSTKQRDSITQGRRKR